jgi:glucose-6-phosphate 1-dehydrogenase
MVIRKKPVTIVLFGATGDLAVKKLFPALKSLFDKNELPKGSRVVAVSRRKWNDGEFHHFVSEKIGNSDFVNTILYSEVEFEGGYGYRELYERLKSLDVEFGETDWLFYLSLAPRFYDGVIGDIKKSKLLSKSSSKLLIEKPFGTSESSAKKLNKSVMSFLKHEQVYRVDHYLGKETVRAIMSMHESGPWLSKLLTNETVESITIRLLESISIEARGSSYDGVGAFRDVGQNHMLVMLSVLSVVPPKTNGSIAWHHARAKTLKALTPPTKTCSLSCRGQYSEYIKESGVGVNSKTETAFEVVTSFTDGKLKNVPIIFQAGKKMSKSEVSIEIKMKSTAPLKSMSFYVQPEQKVRLDYGDRVEETVLTKSKDAYEYIFSDAMNGYRAHFVGGTEVVASWRYADRIVACWNKVPLEIYNSEKPFIKD